MDKLCVRDMTLNDIEAVYAIEHTTFSIPWSKESLIHDISNNPCARYLVIQYNDTIVGYAGIWVILDEGHITNIAISADYRGRGFGSILSSSLLEYASSLGVNYVTLEVRKSNLIAQKLYKSLGFIKLSVRKEYYEDNREDALLMVCDRMPPINEQFEDKNFIKLMDITTEVNE